jgi:transposase
MQMKRDPVGSAVESKEGSLVSEESERKEPVAEATATRPDPEVAERAVRRKFSARYKLHILDLADKCMEPGSLGKLLRKEGLYSSALSDWRRQREQGILRGLSPAKRGPKAPEPNPLLPEVEQLRKENKRLMKRLNKAELLLDVQKKISQLLGLEAMEGDN